MVAGALRDSGWPRCTRAAIGRMMLGLPAEGADAGASAAAAAEAQAEKPGSPA
jgi:hypothetical protein